MIWRSECLWHEFEPAVVELEFQSVPGRVELRVIVEGFRRFVATEWAYWTSRNEIRCDSFWGPVIGKLDLEQRAVRMRRFPYQLTIPDRWHILEGEL